MSKQKTLSIEKQEVALCRNIWQNSSQNDCIAITDDAGEVDRGRHDPEGQPRDVPSSRPESDAFGIIAGRG